MEMRYRRSSKTETRCLPDYISMLLKDKQTGELVKVMDADVLIDPTKSSVSARLQAGQEEQDPEEFAKDALVFPSDEALPLCWKDANYQMRS